MSAYIISDLHLNKDKPLITLNFLRFIQKYLTYYDDLYIIGDFFDYWIGDDDNNKLHQKIAFSLKQLNLRNINCYFIHGNRDFLIGNFYAEQCGMKILPQETLLNIYNKRIVILHGDTLCTNDIEYQKYRKKIYKPYLQNIFLKLPLFIRHKIAKKIKNKTKDANISKSKFIVDVNLQSVINTFNKHKAQWIIHGHTHKPAIHKIYINNKIHYRGVLDAWCNKNSTFIINNKGIKLLFF
ncbi:UDP-2,3-diacylglucosamine diphosphatase [Candidatus Providencia siddallii]|uniref:UDP-2,3-diacylglucosamine hydrolase n=1 Tax=Candidatus Providencia siddallii TaxID=1715285 RepID=A0ABM9NPG1_9GAMM